MTPTTNAQKFTNSQDDGMDPRPLYKRPHDE
jgi:hypothetical protein